MRSLERIGIAMTFVCICPSETGVHCNHTVHFSADLSLWLDSPMFWAPWHKACPPTSSRLFPSIWKRGGVWMCKLGVKKLSYYWVLTGSHICRVDWHNGWPWVTLNGRFTVRRYRLFGMGVHNVTALCTSSTLKSTPSASRAISAVAEYFCWTLIWRSIVKWCVLSTAVFVEYMIWYLFPTRIIKTKESS